MGNPMDEINTELKALRKDIQELNVLVRVFIAAKEESCKKHDAAVADFRETLYGEHSIVRRLQTVEERLTLIWASLGLIAVTLASVAGTVLYNVISRWNLPTGS